MQSGMADKNDHSARSWGQDSSVVSIHIRRHPIAKASGASGDSRVVRVERFMSKAVIIDESLTIVLANQIVLKTGSDHRRTRDFGHLLPPIGDTSKVGL